MKWQLTAPHYINEQVLPAGTIIGDDTAHPYRSNHTDHRIGRKKGDHLPPSTDMIPLDDEAHEAYKKEFGEGHDAPGDPSRSVPLTGAENSPLVRGPAAPEPNARQQTPVNPPPAPPPRPTGMAASTSSVRPPLSPAQAQPQLKPELKKPEGHDSSKNPGDAKDTETAKAPDINKL